MKKDYLWLNLRELPYFRAVLRAVEARFYQDFELEKPVLDLGCGDGQFVTVVFDEPLDVGIDPWTGPVRNAALLGGYEMVIQGNGNQLPFEDGHFSSMISNSVLEHIPDVDAVLCEAARVLKPGGLFLFCVPNHNFLSNLSISNALEKLKLCGLANWYRAFFNKISRHYHCDSVEVWDERLRKAGFRIEKWWHYFSPKSLSILEWGHYFGLPSLITKKLFGRWILAPSRWNLRITQSVVQSCYDEDPFHQPDGSYTFYVVRRICDE